MTFRVEPREKLTFGPKIGEAFEEANEWGHFETFRDVALVQPVEHATELFHRSDLAEGEGYQLRVDIDRV
jgi:hypothetical protein